MADPDLSPFILADKGLIADSLVELEQGRKRSHWMWFIFPQITGLVANPSATTQRFALHDVDHARALLADTTLGSHLRACTDAVLGHPQRTAEEIFGAVDSAKFHACMTLFAAIDEPQSCFEQAIDVFFQGNPDPKTMQVVTTQGQS